MIQKFNIEKVTNYNYFLTYTSFIFFADIYFIYFLNTNILNINITILKNNIGHIFVLLFLFMFVMAIISKIASYLINMIYIYKFKNYNNTISKTDYMLDTDIKNIAIEKNNSVLYNYYIEHQKLVESIYNEKYLSTGILLILICNFFISTNTNKSLTQIFLLFLENGEWYYKIISILPVGIIFYIFYSVLNIGELYYIYLPKKLQDKLIEDENANETILE